MNNLKNTQPINLYDFVKNYMRIKDNKGNIQPFSNKSLNDIKYIEKMMNNGFKPKIIHLRKLPKIHWVKN